MATAETADLLGFGPPPADDTAATPPRRGSGQVDLLGMGFGVDEHANAAAAKETEHYESPTAVASLQQDMAAVDLLSGAPEVDMLDDRAHDGTEEKKTDETDQTTTTTSTVVTSAPALAGMSKISRSSTNASTAAARNQQQHHQPKRRPRIIVPHRSIGMGLDVKFEEDPTKTNLHDILAPHEYRAIAAAINDDLREVRATNVDKALMATAPLVVPLAVFGKRQSRRSREKKHVLHEAIVAFNEDHPTLRMMWTKSVAGDYLCIVERDEALDVPIAVNNQLPTGLE